MIDLKTFFIIIGVFLALVVVLYLVVCLRKGEKFLMSRVEDLKQFEDIKPPEDPTKTVESKRTEFPEQPKKPADPKQPAQIREPDEIKQPLETDHYYYLPAASLSVKATAVIQIERSEKDKTIVGTSLAQLMLEPQVHIVPDMNNFISLNYQSSWFSNDEIKITTAANALLENISAVSEDRIGMIVSTLTGAVTDNKVSGRDAGIAQKEATTIETITIERQFEINHTELESPPIVKTWLINFPGNYRGTPEPVDAGFTINSATTNKRKKIAASDYNGILTRRLIQKEFTLLTNGSSDPISFTCMVPDISSLLSIPVRRSYFIKKQQVPKFKDGLLIENQISKPSEMEGLASIPVNILKAILSIPAQLLQFTINHNKLETEKEKSVSDLTAARQKNLPPEGNSENPTGKTASPAMTTHSNSAASKKPDDPYPALGKEPASDDGKETKSILEVINSLDGGRGATFNFDEKCFYPKTPTSWQHYNNTIGGKKTCVPAAAAHCINCWTSNAQVNKIELPVEVVMEIYTQNRKINSKTGLPDGCVLQSFIFGWQKTPLANKHPLVNYCRFKEKKRDELKQSIFLFGACIIGLQLPQTARTQTSIWEVVAGDATRSERPNSWGGHAVAVTGYDKMHLHLVSWGKPMLATWEFYETYNDESYALLSPEWIDPAGKSPLPGMKNMSFLRNAINEMNKENLT